ncbi:uncharacterized protein LOC113506531 isoform X2 [Trichoplusia ni]|uniref:Uncharacterized protein LOC113506531 isoform X2 n=1 Tax=Trichoplusia ni TaxID=7111 RepID=A0A7E5WYA4_TRINI|nr:uncharacterized protein LOC113506531 isoform X2 [Trichoplusia ni]
MDNSNLRQRKLKDDTSAAHINVRSRTIKHPRRLKKVFIFLIVLALFVTYFLDSYISSYFKSRKVQNGKWHGHIRLFAGQSQWLDGLAKSLGYESVFHHAVIIDAGSSGSRVLAYKFRVPFIGESYFFCDV